MILCRDFVVFHVPRTGGTWLREQVREHGALLWQATINDAHWTEADLLLHRPDLIHVPRICFVRNPWDYFVSLFHFWKGHGGFEAQVGKGFESFIRDRVSEGCHQSGWLDQISSSAAPLYIGQFEKLREDSVRLLRQHVALPSSLVRALRSSARLNASQHEHYSSYFEESTRELVRDADANLIERFGYAFEQKATAACWDCKVSQPDGFSGRCLACTKENQEACHHEHWDGGLDGCLDCGIGANQTRKRTATICWTADVSMPKNPEHVIDQERSASIEIRAGERVVRVENDGGRLFYELWALLNEASR